MTKKEDTTSRATFEDNDTNGQLLGDDTNDQINSPRCRRSKRPKNEITYEE